MHGWGDLLAIEAQERLFGALWGNITMNNCFNARAIWAAASDKDGVMPGPTVNYGQPGNFGGVSMLPQYNREVPVKDYRQVVAAIAIDSLQLPALDMMKIDVEGMEPQVLRGARATIMRYNPVIYAEHMICGKSALAAELPVYYRHEAVGANCICMPKAEPLWGMLTGLQAA
jgi:FkbM family methyltransferase